MSSLDDWIDKDHPVRILDYIIDQVVLENRSEFQYKGQKRVGRKAYSPNTMLKLYLYGYLNGIRSSRKLEQETYRNIELMWLLGNLKPDHKTISDFRKNHKDLIILLSKKFREFLRDHGYIKGESAAIDGTRIKANARRDMFRMDYYEKELEKIKEKIEEYLDVLTKNDMMDDLEEEGYDTSDRIELESVLLEKIGKLEEKLQKIEKEKELLKSTDRKYVSPSDPEARIMKTKDGKLPAYNVQIVVDKEQHMIAGVDVTTSENDYNQLEQMVEKLREEMSITPKEIICDAGYLNLDSIERIEKSDYPVNCYVPVKRIELMRNKKGIQFKYDEEKDEYICSQGKRLVLKQKNVKIKRGYYNKYEGIECDDCPIHTKCTKSKKSRVICRPVNESWRQAYIRKMKSIEGKQKLKLRRQMVEHPFGTIKCWLGKIPLLVRGKEKVLNEIHLFITAYNFKRLLNITSFIEIKEKIEKYSWNLT
jgi:transposase